MKQPTLKKIADVIIAGGYKLFTDPFDVNLGAIRTKDNAANTFNDWNFCFYYDDEGQIQGVVVPGTTDAGLYWRINPMHIDGTAIIQHGVQHRGAYQLQNPKVDGKRGHRGQKAFRQIKNMKYWRDADRDQYLDFDGEEQTAIFYTNGHYMGTLGKNVNKWSAGCWGATVENMDKIFEVAEAQIAAGLGDRFSFTLLHENEFTN